MGSLGIARAAAIGVGFWLLGVIIIHWGARSEAWAGAGRLWFFAASVPLMAGAVWVLGRLRPGALVPAVAVATAAAAFCDVVTLTWFPGAYAAEPATALSGVVLLLWGIALALGLACWAAMRRRLVKA